MNGIMEDYLSIIRKYDNWISSEYQEYHFQEMLKRFLYQVAIRDSMIQFGLHLFLKRYRLKIEVFLRKFVISSYFINSLFSHWNVNYDINYDIPNLVDNWIN